MKDLKQYFEESRPNTVPNKSVSEFLKKEEIVEKAKAERYDRIDKALNEFMKK
jgi:hypothetical protein